jgi:hypothetical protein
LGQFKQRAFYFWVQFLAFKSATTTTSATATARATAITATSTSSSATTLALGHHVDAGACGIRLTLTATLGFVAKGIDTALGA